MIKSGRYRASYNAASNLVVEFTEDDEPSGRRYFPPVGTETERESNKIWPGEWVDANGYLRWYYTGSHWAWHTGADLNLNSPYWDADAHSPVYSIADGVVYYVGNLSGWANVICIEHEDCLSRYAHVENVQVRNGDSVHAGTHIANIGNAGGAYPYHLHFDITKLTARMKTVPGDWPRGDKSRVLRDYLDPTKFLRERMFDVNS